MPNQQQRALKRIIQYRKCLLLVVLLALVGCSEQPDVTQNHSEAAPSSTATSALAGSDNASMRTPVQETQETAVPTPTESMQSTSSSPIDIALTGVQRNAAWEPHAPYIRIFEGVEMVLVPAGCFVNGDGGEEQQQCFEEPFWIDRYEVSQATFSRLGGTQSDPPADTGAMFPVENITWREARAFCTSRQADLPTELEWEYAAGGVDELVYPWGNEWESSAANGAAPLTEDDYETLAPVDAFPKGVSWVGAYQMGGNVWEWVVGQDDLYVEGIEYLTPTPPELMYRGGSYINDNERAFQTTYRFPQIEHGDKGFNVGFRCARSFALETETQ